LQQKHIKFVYHGIMHYCTLSQRIVVISTFKYYVIQMYCLFFGPRNVSPVATNVVVM